MRLQRSSKKTSTIELRVSPELKDAIGRFSAARGETMSETIRALVTDELRGSGGRSNRGVGMMRLAMRSPVVRGGMMMASVGALAVAYTFAGQGTATASVGAEARVTFAEIDRNGDNLITPGEYAAVLAEERAQEDEAPPIVPAACEGTFIAEEIAEERAEFDAPTEALAEERVAHLDSNSDGAVTFDELEAFLVADRAREFLEYDDDGNGFVTLAEVEAIFAPGDRAAEEAWLAEEGIGAECIAAVLGPDDGPDETEDPRVILAEYDVDRDGRVSLREFLER